MSAEKDRATTLRLLERIVSLQEEQIELQREGNQLFGEVLARGDVAASRAVSSPTDFRAPEADSLTMSKELSLWLEEPEVTVIWPRGKAPSGWVRVVLKAARHAVLVERVSGGCLCGGELVKRAGPEGEFYTCVNVSRSACGYRPSVNFDDSKFLINMPPRRA